MPPTRAAPKEASFLAAAADFSSPVRIALPSDEKDAPTKEQVQKTWKNAIIKIRGNSRWHVFQAIQDWKPRNRMDSMLKFVEIIDSQNPSPARLQLKVILDEEARDQLCSAIILGAIGGTREQRAETDAG